MLPVIDSELLGSERGAERAEDAQGTPTQSHIQSSTLVYEEYKILDEQFRTSELMAGSSS